MKTTRQQKIDWLLVNSDQFGQFNSKTQLLALLEKMKAERIYGPSYGKFDPRNTSRMSELHSMIGEARLYAKDHKLKRLKTFAGDVAKYIGGLQLPQGPQFQKEVLDQLDRLELWSGREPDDGSATGGERYEWWRGYDASGVFLKGQKVAGF